MRLLIGTLYSGENEFDDCVASIERQSHQDFEHMIIEHMVKKEAYERLHGRFMNEADVFDVLVRVDADMVLTRDDLFAGIVKCYEENPWMDMLQIQVYDWLSEQPVWGLQTHRKTVKWKRNDRDLFADNTPVPVERRLNDDRHLAPAAVHCPDPTPFHAFHYGMHRGLKMLQPDRRTRRQKGQAFAHLRRMNAVWDHFRRTRDARLALAVLGAELALQGAFEVAHKDYANPYAEQVFRGYKHMNYRELKHEVGRLRRRGFAFLPADVRMELLWFLNEERRLGRDALGRLAEGLLLCAKRSSAAEWLREHLPRRSYA